MSTRHAAPPLSCGRGMVLVAVLWIVAALSIIVTGMIHSVRGEIRQVGVSSQVTQGSALGSGAIAVVLQRLASNGSTPVGYLRSEIKLQDREITVHARALSGYIDLNLAQPPLLEKLFTVAAGLPVAAANALTQALLQYRDRKDVLGRPMRLEAVEDLLQVPGVDYEVYAKVADLLTTDSRGSGRINVLAAPLSVLNVLAGGNEALAQRIAQDRDAGAVGLDTTALNPQLVDNALSRRYLLQARVPLPDGRWLLVSRWVDVGGGRREGLPWRVFHADQRMDNLAP